jgi:AraC family transcriptional regulator
MNIKATAAPAETHLSPKHHLVSDDLHLTQGDGGLPTTLVAGSAPGESGVSIFKGRFRGSAHFSGTPRQHLIWFSLSSQVRHHCRIGDHTLQHEPTTGSLAICPAGICSAAHTDAGVDMLIIAIQPDRFTLAAAEDAALDAQLDHRLVGYDATLFELGGLLADEGAAQKLNEPLFWNDVASRFVDRLVDRHASPAMLRRQRRLGKRAVERVREYVMDHLDEAIDVETLAGIAHLSPFHFSRMFARSVGVTPHRYVVRLRLRRAVELLREGRLGLAEIAARTGFADQSHLSRWMRRVHGVPLTRLRS